MTLPDPNRTIVQSATSRAYPSYWPAAVALLVAVVVRSFSWLNCDVSWLLTLGEQVLAGARPYIDFSEPNPPASILIYLPAIVSARIAGLEPELAVTLLAFAGVVLSLWLCGRILSDGELLQPHERASMAALGCILLLILPGDAFAQREHIALIAIMPMLCVYGLRANGASVGTAFAVLVGIGGGIAVAIKPYFASALLVPFAYVAWRTRRQRLASLIFAPEHVSLGLVLAAYAGVIVALFSNYIRDMLPIVLAVYAPLRVSNYFAVLATSIILIAMNILVARAVGATEFRNSIIRVFVLAVVGFAIAMLAQAKSWQYHSYPAMALSLLVLGFVLLQKLSNPEVRLTSPISWPQNIVFGAALFAALYAIESFWFLSDPSRVRLVQEVARLAPAHPRVASINGGAEFAFPLTRKLQGTPIWPAPFQWISAGADRMLQSAALDPATRSTLERYAWTDRQELVRAIRAQRPDVILIGTGPDERWSRAHAEVADALTAYRQVKTVDGVEIWLPHFTTGVP